MLLFLTDRSLEEDRGGPAGPSGLSSGPLRGGPSPPTIRLSHSSSQSSSMEQAGSSNPAAASAGAGGQLIVAKKKRELFSNRSSRSGGSAHSSTSVSDSKDHSHLYKVKTTRPFFCWYGLDLHSVLCKE